MSLKSDLWSKAMCDWLFLPISLSLFLSPYRFLLCNLLLTHAPYSKQLFTRSLSHWEENETEMAERIAKKLIVITINPVAEN